METSKIVITETDLDRLRRLIDSSRRFGRRDADHLDALEEELDRAVIKSGPPPDGIVALDSSVRLKDLNSGRELTYQIVLPKDAKSEENRISVLAPIGTAVLGYSVGSTVEWTVPAGVRRFEIIEVEHQPDAKTAAA